MLLYHSTFKNSTSDLKSNGKENHIFWAEIQQSFPGDMQDNNAGMPLRFQVVE